MADGQFNGRFPEAALDPFSDGSCLPRGDMETRVSSAWSLGKFESFKGQLDVEGEQKG